MSEKFPPQDMGHDRFEACLDDTFTIDVEGGESVEATLAEVSDRGDAPAEGERDRAFSLLFQGAGNVRIPQGIHRLRHPELGEMDLFLVPVGPDDEGTRFEAVFG